MNLLKMHKKYYSSVKGDSHFTLPDRNYILKDGPYIDYTNSNYYIDQANRDLINPEQILRLKEDLTMLKFR